MSQSESTPRSTPKRSVAKPAGSRERAVGKPFAAPQHTAAELISARDRAVSAAAEAKRKFRALEEELSGVKRKYRAAQHDFQRERRAHAATKTQLVALENTLARYQKSALWGLYLALTRLWNRILALVAKLSLAKRKRRREEMQLIAASGLFDKQWYLRKYPDVASDRIDALVHFYDNGWREGRDPGPQFGTSAYLKANADVARSGLNPLLHYIEYGRSEGRPLRISLPSSHSGTGSRSPAAPAVAHHFPEAAPVYRGKPVQDRAVQWERSYRLAGDNERSFVSGGLVVGFVAEDDRALFESAFARLTRLSGLESSPALAETAWAEVATKMRDGWYVNEVQLRTRWAGSEWPFVIRAYQHDPESGELALVGEALLASSLDVLDVSLVDPWFPVLFVICEPAGRLRESTLLAFPSLCRGGIHYPELLATSPEQPDPIVVGLAEAARLERARHDSSRLIGSIAVDVSGADGTSPLFNDSFRRWLAAVARVSVRAAEPSGPAADLLPSSSSRVDCGLLELACDMVPTLRGLSLLEGDGEPSDDAVFVPLVVSGIEATQPATLVTLPPTAPSAAAATATSFPFPWPRFVPKRPVSIPELGAPLAVRVPRGREISDAELLVPVSAPALAIAKKPATSIAWVAFPAEWGVETLLRSMEALSVQEGDFKHSIIFVGPVDETTVGFATKLFGDSITVADDAADVARALKTKFVGYLGPGVVLHDARCAAFLLQFLDDASVVSAACALLSVEPRGKGWQVSVADAGSSAGSSEGSLAKECDVSQVLWRSAFPVAQPPQDFWVARSSAARKWFASPPPQRLASGVHLCTTLLSGSYLVHPREESPAIRVPPASEEDTVRVRVLYG